MKIFKKSATILSFILLLIPAVSFSASLFFDSPKKTFGTGEEFLVDVFLNTESQKVNAVGGEVLFPQDLLKVKEIRSGNSSINFWIDKPITNSDGTISFSGITPGGFSGDKQALFSIIFVSEKAGTGSINFSNLKILQNDGVGTEAKVTNVPFAFSVTTSLVTDGNIGIPQDDFPPEDFKPSIGRDSSLFDGKYFLVFATQDKQSGISHYEVREGLWGDFVAAESPYLLKDQSLYSFIYVKAVDLSGKERVARLTPGNLTQLELYAILSIIIVLVLLFLLKKLWRRDTQ